MDCDCASVFNRLSVADRLKLKSAALTKAASGFARDDTQKHPWRYPVYASYFLALFIPVPFVEVALFAVTAMWASTSRSPEARELQNRLKQSFNQAALVKDHKQFIEPDPLNPENCRVRNWPLLWDTTKTTLNDSGKATGYAWNALKRSVLG